MVIWNTAGVSRLSEAMEFLEDFDIVLLQETWIDKTARDRFVNSLSEKCNWTTKAVTRDRGKGRASGGQVVGIKNNINSAKVDEWKYGLKIGDERWPKIFLKEEMRNWKNGNASKWIKGVEMAMRRVGDGVTMRGLRQGMDAVRLLIKMAEGWRIIEDQTTQEYFYRIDISVYCPEYGEWK